MPSTLEILRESVLWKSSEPLFYWRDPRHSSLLFLISNLFFFLITVGEYSVLSLLCHEILEVMCCFQIYSFLYKNESDPFQTLSFHQFVPSPEFVDGTLVTINKLFSLLVTSILTAALTSDFSLMIGVRNV
eukprot:TRINITY_DN3591_c1_g1_i5.p1 TRINITY_DN3591_c1_g1~~TRINITY_DN3591_c1_g1_i5.p1  ORF type:complete len:131 (+),score=12.84 TRINITY_DN3591_c1_g1_i5:80-472(+)